MINNFKISTAKVFASILNVNKYGKPNNHSISSIQILKISKIITGFGLVLF